VGDNAARTPARKVVVSSTKRSVFTGVVTIGAVFSVGVDAITRVAARSADALVAGTLSARAESDAAPLPTDTFEPTHSSVILDSIGFDLLPLMKLCLMARRAKDALKLPPTACERAAAGLACPPSKNFRGPPSIFVTGLNILSVGEGKLQQESGFGCVAVRRTFWREVLLTIAALSLPAWTPSNRELSPCLM
jgi:hypothetical protein